MELRVLKFRSYPHALNWLDQSPSVAVTPLDWFKGFRTYCMLLISAHVSEGDRGSILSRFPCVYKARLTTQLEYNIQHDSYVINATISEILESLKALGGVVRDSPCYLRDVLKEEVITQLQEISSRAGQDWTQLNYKQMGELYRSCAHNKIDD
jgi:hypothetical protein